MKPSLKRSGTDDVTTRLFFNVYRSCRFSRYTYSLLGITTSLVARHWETEQNLQQRYTYWCDLFLLAVMFTVAFLVKFSGIQTFSLWKSLASRSNTSLQSRGRFRVWLMIQNDCHDWWAMNGNWSRQRKGVLMFCTACICRVLQISVGSEILARYADVQEENRP